MRFLLPGIASIIILILYIVSFDFRFYIHTALNIITHGVSGGKIYFLLIYSALSFLFLFFSQKRSVYQFDKNGHLLKKVFFGSVILGMASSMGSYVFYLYKNSLSPQAYHYHFKEIYNSVNFFPHIHTSKLYLFIAGKTWGFSDLLAGMDDGRVFENSIPAFFPYITLTSIIVVTIISFILITYIVNSWEKKYQTGVSFISVLSFSSVIKTMSDGGPFAYDFLIGLWVIWIISLSKTPDDILNTIKNRWKIIFWYFFSVFSIMCIIDSSFEIFFYTLKNCVGVFLVYFAIYFFTLMDYKPKRLHLLISMFLLAFFSYTVYVRYSVYIKPFRTYLERGTQINYFYYRDRPLSDFLKNASVLFSGEFFTVYTFKTEKKVKVIEIYKTLNENPYRNRHIAIITPKKRQAYGILAELLFIDFENKYTSLKVPKLMHIKLSKKDTKTEKFYAEIAFDTTYFPALSYVEEGKITQLDENHKFVMYYFLNRLFFYYGINEYILTPVAFYRFN